MFFLRFLHLVPGAERKAPRRRVGLILCGAAFYGTGSGGSRSERLDAADGDVARDFGNHALEGTARANLDELGGAVGNHVAD